MQKRCFKFLTSKPSNPLWSIICKTNPQKNVFFENVIKNSQKIMCADGGSNDLHKFILNYQKEKNSSNLKNGEFIKISHLLPEFILGDLDSIKKSTINFFLENKVKIKNRKNQNFSDLEKLLYEIEKNSKNDNNSKSLEIPIFANGERLDHFFYNLNICLKNQNSEFYKNKNFYIIGNTSYMTIIKKGKTKIFPSNFDLKSKIGIFPLKPSKNISSKGLKWNLNFENEEKWGFFYNLSTSNSISANEVVFESDVDLVWTSSIGEGSFYTFQD